MEKRKKAILYARFSSENQKNESIDFQIRAIKECANRNNVDIIGTYIDRAKSATTDKRPDFQRMIKDSEDSDFEIVYVFKLDRFARSKYDSVFYKRKLLKNGVKVVSVTEQLDDSPESVILESVLEGMADYYSKNLSNLVNRGMYEGGLKCIHMGGSAPLGLKVEKETRKYLIDEEEAKAVRLIFEKYLQGYTVISIITELNSLGFKTKKGASFGSNSIRNIIKNEKYCGTYVFNKSASKDAFGKRNNNKTKDEKDIIRVKGAIPAIISEDDYNKAQALMETRRNGGQGRQKAKEIYLLSGIIKCSCGHAMYGNRRKPKGKPLYVSYRCGARHKKGANSTCTNPEIKKEYIEEYTLTELENFLVNDATASSIVDNVNKYVDQENNVYREKLSYIEKKLTTIDGQTENIIEAIMSGFKSEELKSKLDELKIEKATLELEKNKYSKEVTTPKVDVQTIREKLNKLKEYVQKRDLPECKKLIKDFVDSVNIYQDHVEVKLNMVSFIFKDLEGGETIKKKRKDLYVKHSHDHYFNFLKDHGYEYNREVSTYGMITR